MYKKCHTSKFRTMKQMYGEPKKRKCFLNGIPTAPPQLCPFEFPVSKSHDSSVGIALGYGLDPWGRLGREADHSPPSSAGVKE